MAPNISYVDAGNSSPKYFFKRLWIYDASISVFQDMVPANKRPDTYILPVEGKLGPDGKAAPPLMADLFQMLVRDRVTFQSAIFMFHGKSGTLRMDGDDMGVNEWKWYFADKGLDRLFPNAMSRLYFPGCDVADGEDGWKFLETAGSILLRGHGGLSYGWTSLGFAVPSWMPWIGDHAVHPWGETRYVIVSPGGALKRVDD